MDRDRWSVRGDRRHVRLAVRRRRGGEDDATHTGAAHGVQQGEAAHHVVVPVDLRRCDRLSHQRLRREVEDGLDAVGENVLGLGDGRVHERGTVRDGIGVPCVEVVQHDDLVPRLEQLGRHDRPDVPGTAGDQKLHGALTFLARRPSSDGSGEASERSGPYG